jgi:hypothetical protein
MIGLKLRKNIYMKLESEICNKIYLYVKVNFHERLIRRLCMDSFLNLSLWKIIPENKSNEYNRGIKKWENDC